jgi:ribose transport system ATP-binding protein
MSETDHTTPETPMDTQPTERADQDAMTDGHAPLLEIDHLSKAFPGVQALSNVSLTLERGEILGLVGENGAGKSTLIKILTGLYRADSGEIRIDGRPTVLHSPQEAKDLGISLVPQERNLIPRFSVGENLFLDDPPRQRGIIDYERIHQDARPWLDMLELEIDSRTLVSRLSVAQMQLVEIARALSDEGRILLLDEPTASITPHETQTLFRILRRLRESGVAMIFVSHKLEEVFDICGSVTVLRDGKNAGPQRPTADLTKEDVITLMVGRESVVAELPERTRGRDGVALELREVDTEWGARDISFRLGYGEILGLYGLVGAGRTELARAIIGADRITAGEVLVAGRPARIGSVSEALHRYRIGYVSEDRKEEGLIPIHSILKNITITVWRRLQRFLGWVPSSAEKAVAEPMMERLDIKAPSMSTVVASLSGGNQQKVSLAKWLTAGVDVLIIDEPTVGIDIRTKGNLHELIWELSEQGLAVILISSDMPEMVKLADRIVVMRGGRIVGELQNDREYEGASQRIMGFIQSVRPSGA